jgi:hypothetical protein
VGCGRCRVLFVANSRPVSKRRGPGSHARGREMCSKKIGQGRVKADACNSRGVVGGRELVDGRWSVRYGM